MGGCQPKMAGCDLSCGHLRKVWDYRYERQRQELVALDRSGGYAPEYADEVRDNPLIHFRQFLQQTKGEREAAMAEWKPDEAWTAEAHRIDRLTKTDRTQEAALTAQEGRRAREWQEWAEPSRPGVDSVRDSHEQGLLGSAMRDDAALPALRALDIENDFANGFHQHVAHAVLDLSDGNLTAVERDNRPTAVEREHLGMPPYTHGSDPVTDLLRERGQLPFHLDPEMPLWEVDRGTYGIAAWESGALPPAASVDFAHDIRGQAQTRHLEGIGVRAGEAARGIAGTDVGFGTNGMRWTRENVARELLEMPPELGWNLEPVSWADPSPTSLSVPNGLRHDSLDLRLPPPPILSAAGRAALTPGGR